MDHDSTSMRTVFLTLVIQTSMETGCPTSAMLTLSQNPLIKGTYWDPAVGGNGHWYLISSELQLDWSSAADRSHAKGGHLASITSPEENQFLTESYEQNSLSLTPWIGSIRDATVPEESWIWYTGEPVVWTNWSPGNPDFDNEVQANIYLWSESPSGNPGCCPLGTWNN